MTTEPPAPLASPGARWTLWEDEELVAAVVAGTDLSAVAERHGRARSGIESRLLKMIPAGENIPERERLGWIMAKLADPGFDWRTPLAPHRPRARDRAPLPSRADEVLDIWQQINGSELSDERRARFVTSPALGDLVGFKAEVLWEQGRRLYQVQGHLLLNDWATECAMPGLTDLRPAAGLREQLVKAGEAVRRLVAAAVAALPDQGDRKILERRLGLSGGGPQTLDEIGGEFGVTRERIRQRLERGVKAVTTGRARAGFQTAQARARRELSGLVHANDGTVDEAFVLAVAELSLPHVYPGFAARLIMGVAGIRRQSSAGKSQADPARP